jgi:hypothetical protein
VNSSYCWSSDRAVARQEAIAVASTASVIPAPFRFPLMYWEVCLEVFAPVFAGSHAHYTRAPRSTRKLSKVLTVPILQLQRKVIALLFNEYNDCTEGIHEHLRKYFNKISCVFICYVKC